MRGVPEQVDAVGALAIVHVVAASIDLQPGLERVLPGKGAEKRRIHLRIDARQPIDPAHVVRQIRLEPAHLLQDAGTSRYPMLDLVKTKSGCSVTFSVVRLFVK